MAMPRRASRTGPTDIFTAFLPRYYYDVLTRETQWTKPRELQDAAEREALDAKEAEKRAFFDEMERNMRANLANGPPAARKHCQDGTL